MDYPALLKGDQCHNLNINNKNNFPLGDRGIRI